MEITSAYANKLLKQLNEEKDYWLKQEASSCTYTATVDEEAVIPDYDYAAVSGKIAEIDAKICRIKHAINLANVTSLISVNGEEISVDTVLVTMAQLNRRKEKLDGMRKHLPKQRIESVYARRMSLTPEYEYVNYDLDQVKADYEKVSRRIMDLQMALDIHNQTATFDVSDL